MVYTEKVMDHFMNPRNVGVMENPDGYGKIGSPSCGDMMEIFLKIEDEIIKDVKFRTFGCASAIASSSVTTEMILNTELLAILVKCYKANWQEWEEWRLETGFELPV